MYIRDTIYALSTVMGKSGVAVIRISGVNAFGVFSQFGIKKKIHDRVASFCKIYDPKTSAPLDECLVLKFPGPHSFTGENVVELHLHGGLSVIQDTCAALSSMHELGLRIADAGEFSKRAFYNNKLDLVEAEALSLLIDAETSKQREVALRQLGGIHTGLFLNIRQKLIRALANLEALIDFHEEDIPVQALEEVAQIIASVMEEIRKVVKTAARDLSVMQGIRLPIIGPPNAGKSSLLNYLAGEDIAITSDIEGTTRDVISVKIDIGGYAVILKDTAGLRETMDPIESIGVSKAQQELHLSDIALVLFEAHNIDPTLLQQLEGRAPENTIVVINKIDQGKVERHSELERFTPLYISLLNGLNVDTLLSRIKDSVITNFSAQETVITKYRYKDRLERALGELENFSTDKLLDFGCQDLRNAASYIDEIIGRIDVEEILDEIFSSFCIGK